MHSAHVDTFARDNLPAAELQPDYLLESPDLQFPARLNCATELLERHIEQGRGGRACIRAPGLIWTYSDLQAKANRIANVLVRDMGLVPGNRVLLRAPNNPMLAACWFAVVKAGGIVVATMPLLRAKELKSIVELARVTHALCDASLADELRLTALNAPFLRQIRHFNYQGPDSLEAAMERHSPEFENADTSADDTCIFGFTSGTTGVPKATMHFHRDVMAVCKCWPRHVLRPTADDVFIGSPPLAFTFGLGGLLLFPMEVGASTVLLEKVSPPQLLAGVKEFGATVLFTVPTSYRALAGSGTALRGTSLRKCVSAGEALPASTRALWREATGIELIDGIGTTEMLHIFISHDESNSRPGATGKPVAGYRARVVDDEGTELPPGTVGRLAVQGPTGCRYLADERQKTYVSDGWNLTGDAFLMDADGYFFYLARTDDMIVSSGYNIAAPEVEDALLRHPAVAECAVVGVADDDRGQVVKAFVVLGPGQVADGLMAKELQDFVKREVAPYKYPRALEFVDELPRAQSGKLQRFKLKEPG